MTYLIAGLVLFLGVHSVRIVADGWRAAQIARIGANPWKAVYSIASIAGFALILYGYGVSRQTPVELWAPPLWTRHLTALLTLPVFTLLAAAYVPGTAIKARVGHPMLLGVILWSLAHLLSNGRLDDLLLFGGFLVWSTPAFLAARERDRQAGTRYASAGLARDFLVIGIGLAVWAAFSFYLHQVLIGVSTH